MRFLSIVLRETGEQSHVYDVFCNNQKAGICCFTTEEGKLSLNYIETEEDFLNQGIATAIIRKLASQYRLPIYLTDNAGRKEFYENRGFTYKETGCCKKWGTSGGIRRCCTIRLIRHLVLAKVKIHRVCNNR